MSRVKEQLENIEWDIHEQPQEEQKPIELSGDIATDLFGIEPVKAQEMVSGLSTIFSEREVLKNAYIDVIELPINTENLPTFKELRLKIRDNRTKGIEKWHTANKAFYLAGGRFVDAIKNREVLENIQMEEKLMEAEKFFENQEKQRKIELNNKRIEIIRHYVDDVTGLDFDVMTDEYFDDFVLGKKTRFETARAEAEAEAKRVEEARLAEIERQRLIEVENAKLKADAELKEKIRKERGVKMQPYIVYIRDYNKLLEMSDADFEKEISSIHKGAMDDMRYQAEKIQAEENERIAQAKKERQEFEKATELRLKEEAVKKAREEKEKSEALAIAEAEKLAKAPVKKQLSVWVNSFELPTTEVNNETSKEIKEKFEAFKKWSINQINNL